MAAAPKKLGKSGVRPWRPYLLEQLRDPKMAALYVAHCQDEGVSLTMALADVVEAQGLAKVARQADMAMPNVARALTKTANPTYKTLGRLLDVLGLELSVRKRQHKTV